MEWRELRSKYWCFGYCEKGHAKISHIFVSHSDRNIRVNGIKIEISGILLEPDLNANYWLYVLFPICTRATNILTGTTWSPMGIKFVSYSNIPFARPLPFAVTRRSWNSYLLVGIVFSSLLLDSCPFFKKKKTIIIKGKPDWYLVRFWYFSRPLLYMPFAWVLILLQESLTLLYWIKMCSLNFQAGFEYSMVNLFSLSNKLHKFPKESLTFCLSISIKKLKIVQCFCFYYCHGRFTLSFVTIYASGNFPLTRKCEKNSKVIL